MNGCNGSCCESFPLGGLTFSGIAALAQEYNADDELEKIAFMVIPKPSQGPWPEFCCLHFDAIGKKCMNYENRPRMCSNYPYDSICTKCFMTLIQIEGRELA